MDSVVDQFTIVIASWTKLLLSLLIIVIYKTLPPWIFVKKSGFSYLRNPLINTSDDYLICLDRMIIRHLTYRNVIQSGENGCPLS